MESTKSSSRSTRRSLIAWSFCRRPSSSMAQRWRRMQRVIIQHPIIHILGIKRVMLLEWIMQPLLKIQRWRTIQQERKIKQQWTTLQTKCPRLSMLLPRVSRLRLFRMELWGSQNQSQWFASTESASKEFAIMERAKAWMRPTNSSTRRWRN